MPDKVYYSAVYLEKYCTFVFKLFKNVSFLSSSFPAVLFQTSLQFSLLFQCTPRQHQFDVIIKVLEIIAAASCSLEIWSLTNNLVSMHLQSPSPYLCFLPNRILAGMQLKKGKSICTLLSDFWRMALSCWGVNMRYCKYREALMNSAFHSGL